MTVTECVPSPEYNQTRNVKQKQQKTLDTLKCKESLLNDLLKINTQKAHLKNTTLYKES